MTPAVDASACNDAFVDLLCILTTNPLAAIPRDHPGAEMWRRHRASEQGRVAMDHPHTRLFDEGLEAAHQRYEEWAEHPLFKFRVTLSKAPAPQSHPDVGSGQSQATAAESAIDEWATADGPYELVDIHDEVVKASMPAVPSKLTPGESLWNPLLPDGGLAPWPANDGKPYAKFIPGHIARRLAVVDASQFDGHSHPKCRTFGSVGRTGRRVSGGGHPCERSDCQGCARQDAAKMLGHLYALWWQRLDVLIYVIPCATFDAGKDAFNKAASRLKDINKPDEKGNYIAFLRRADDECVYVFATGPLNGLWERYRNGWLPTPEALNFARQTALRRPFSNARPDGVDGDGDKNASKTHSSSAGWRRPARPRRNVTYIKGVKPDEALRVRDEMEDDAFALYRRSLEQLPADETDAICHARAAKFRPLHPE